MTVTGIIAEYNPFHNGHKYQLENARKATGADYIIVIMSGDFTQRGNAALIGKYERAKMALLSGADLVIELPVCYATGSAEYFAKGAITILNQLGVVDHLAFGSESGQLDTLSQIAHILLKETPEYQSLLRETLKTGLSFPQARMNVLETLYPEIPDISDVMSTPNNILGIEYLKALSQCSSQITPFTTLRVGADYHEKRLSYSFSSAISIRQSIENECSLTMIEDQVPREVYQILRKEYGQVYPVCMEDFSSMLLYKLITERHKGYSEYLDVTEDFSDRILNHLDSYTNFSDFSFSLKTKEMTYTRICRALTHILLNIKQEHAAIYRSHPEYSYAHVLGFREKSTPLLREISAHSSIPLITKPADVLKGESSIMIQQLNEDLNATCLYQSVAANKYHTPYRNELKQLLLKV